MPNKLLGDIRHWIGWLISSALITTALIIVLHLLEKHCVHTPFWVVGVVFIVVFVIEVITDVIKHYVRLQ